MFSLMEGDSTVSDIIGVVVVIIVVMVTYILLRLYYENRRGEPLD